MSTSETLPVSVITPVNADWAAGLRGSDAIAPGVLSPAQVAGIANELFNELPEEQQHLASTAARAMLPANSAFSGNPFAAVPSPTAPAAPGIFASLTEEQNGSYISTPERSLVPDARSSASSLPAVPGGGVIPTTGPEFSFLQDARPVFQEPNPASETTNTPSQFVGGSVPGDAGFALVPDSFPLHFAQPPAPALPNALGIVDSSALPTFSFIEDARPLFSAQPSIPGPVPADFSKSSESNPFASPLDRNTPQVAGAVAHELGYRAPASFDPDKQPRLLEAFNGVPVVAPADAQADSLGDLGLSSTSFEVEAIRLDFPILDEQVNGHPLIWFDNGATTQKPQSVIDRLSYFYEHENSNVHRAAHELAARSTDAYESAREKTRRFLNAGSTREIVFVRGATEGINLVAQSWGQRNIQKDDEIVVSWMEHHANIVPWQMLCAEKGALLRVAPVDDTGQILLDEYEKLLGPKTRLVSITHVSNALGTVLPVKEMVEAAHRHGARVLVDGAQAVSHMRVDVQSINCDFYVFSGHKVFAPTGIGVVYGKSEVLDQMPPWQGGGNMIQDVTFEKTLYQPPPQRFEAGTGNIADAVGLGAAIDYLDRVGIANVARHEHMLLTYATTALLKIPGLRIIGTAKEKASVISFVIDGFRTEEVGDYLNRRGIAVRGGHHCAQPILRLFGLESTVRATFALYNTCEEVDAFVAALWDLRQGRSTGTV
jgi:cysteine desulfurase/selenocysteine lyase